MSNATPNIAASKAPSPALEKHEPTAFGGYLLLRRLTRGPADSFLVASEARKNFQELCYLRQFSTQDYPDTSPNALKDFQQHLFAGLPELFEVGQVGQQYFWVFSYMSGRDVAWFLEHCQRHHAPIPLGIVLYLLQEISGILLECQDRMLLPPQIRAQDFLLSYEGKILYLDAFPGRKPPAEDDWDELGPGRSSKDPFGLVSFCGRLLHEMLTGSKTFPVLPVVGPATEKVRIAEIPDSVAPFLFRALTQEEQHRFPDIASLHREVREMGKKLSASFKLSRLTDFLAAHFDSEITAEQRDATMLLTQNLAGLYRAVSAISPQEKGPSTIDITTGSFGSGAIGSQLGSETPPNPNALIDQQIGGRYRIKRLLGIGGMGWVYQAEHVEIGKQVALKVLHRNLCSNPEVVTRFRREARSASMIGHPNIIEVTDFGSMPDGSVYCVMELLDGTDLAKVLSVEKVLTERRVIHVGIQMCKALSAAHQAGIIHRDMKPANVVLIEKDGQKDFVKILDFGIAKMTGLDEQQTSLTRPGMTMGTPQYMAPEQAAGKPLDARADIYAVGAIMYELLTGSPPFTGLSVMEVLTRKLTQPPPPFASKGIREIHPELEAIVLRCLDRKSDNRPQNCNDVVQQLQGALETLEDPEARKRRPVNNILQGNTSELDIAASPHKQRGWAGPFFGGVAAIAVAGVVGWQLGLLSFMQPPPGTQTLPILSVATTLPAASAPIVATTIASSTQTASSSVPASLPMDESDRIRLASRLGALIDTNKLLVPKDLKDASLRDNYAYPILREALARYPEDPELLAQKSIFVEALIKEIDKKIRREQIKDAEDAIAILEEFGATEEQIEPLQEDIQKWSNSQVAKAELREDRKEDAIKAVQEGNDAFKASRFSDARASYEKALTLLPRYTPAKLGLAKVSFEEGKFADAANGANAVLKSSPSNVDALVLLGDARYKSYNYQGALEAYEKALAISPGSASAQRGKEAAKKKLKKP